MRHPWGRAVLAGALLGAALASSGCAARFAYRQGQEEGRKGNWDLAVARLTKALQKDPRNIRYKISLENARVEASRYHYKEAKKHISADDLDKAAEELQIASNYDPCNKSAADDLVLVRQKIEKREEEKRRLSEFEAMKGRVQAARVPLPVLSPRSPVPITLNFPDASLQKILETLGKLAGVNIIFDEGYRDKRDTIILSNVTFQEALDQVTFKNRLFYKVLDQNTLIIVPESPAKRRSYDEQLVRTFYLQNADVNETLTLVKNLTGISKAAPNPSLGAITIMGTPDKLAYAARIIETNDKARGEVMVDIQILEVNRTNMKNYGIELANLTSYRSGLTFSPTGAAGEVSSDGLTSVRAHLLASLNLADFIVSIPGSLFAKFLETDSTARILASPRLRAAEGKKTSLKIGREIPIPVTTFTVPQAGAQSSFGPATSFQYRNVGVTLDLTPKVMAGGEITLEIAVEVAELGAPRDVGGGLKIPEVLTRNLTGMLRLRDGETALIGGLLQTSETNSRTGVVGSLNVPILNKFLSSSPERKDSEILISITPHLVRAPKVTEEDLAALYVGTEERTSVPSARPPLFGLAEPSPAPSPTPPPAPAPPPTPPPAARPEATVSQAPLVSAPQAPAPVPSPEAVGPAPPSPAPPAVAVPGGPGRPATVLLSPPEATLKAGSTASLSVVVVGARDVTAVEMTLAYDPAMIEVTDSGPGPLLTLDGAAVGIERNLEAGRVRLKLTRPTGASGSGAVATVKVRGLQVGQATLTLESLTLTGASGVERPPSPPSARVNVLP